MFSRQGDTTGPNKYAKLRQLLQGEILAALETHVASVGGHTKTNESYLLLLNSVSEHVFPRNAEKLQKRFYVVIYANQKRYVLASRQRVSAKLTIISTIFPSKETTQLPRKSQSTKL